LSFIEKNKAWLLPLLGLGIVGVGYMNFRTLREEPPPGDPASVEAVPAPSEPPPAPEATGIPPAGGGNPEGTEDLWSDLRSFAVLPGNLAQEGPLRDRARVALGPELEPGATLSLGKPGWVSLSPQGAVPAGTTLEEASGGAATGMPPDLDFLIHGPRGSQAWFGGRPYRTGEKLLDSGYTLSRIGPTFVELAGPHGKLVASTIPVQAVASPSAEAP